ncbi:unnamed protein product [Ceutorhynchus assimilis]|uniref:von Hippel-Lindau disease tumour suppressor beta domain-containing protein n=1 Tax=Ceutorhynchus assimilis TaxID=467358 RepID=A0A9N9MLU0_9CUCU|nr:unnamed protein product [Ceutorhynchus assimilis]
MENNDPNVRSVESTQRCYVRFINTTSKTIDLMWVNFAGVYVRYRILRKDDYIDVNTFKTHPWIAKDFMTKDILHIDSKYSYEPRTSKEIIQERFPDRIIPENHEARIRAYITLPLFSLRYACLLTVRNHMLNEEDVDQLLLPKSLSEDLKKVIKRRNRECSLQVLSREFED